VEVDFAAGVRNPGQYKEDMSNFKKLLSEALKNLLAESEAGIIWFQIIEG